MNKVGAATNVVGPDGAAHVILRHDPKATRDRRFIARVRFAQRGAAVFVSATDANLHVAIDQMVEKITGSSKRQGSQSTGNARPPAAHSLGVRKAAAA